MKTVHMLKARDALSKLSSTESGMSKNAPRGQNRTADEPLGNMLQYGAPFLSAPLLILFAVTVLAAFLAEEAAIGYTSLVTFSLFLYVWYTAYQNALVFADQQKKRCGAYLRVLREGEVLLLPSEDLVRGDILLLESGDRLYADCRVLEIESESLTVRERCGDREITVTKTAEESELRYEDADNMLWTGSAVLSGSCRALVAAVGGGRRFAPSFCDATAEFPVGRYAQRLKRLAGISTVSLLAIVFIVAIYGLTPISSGGLFRDWLFAVSFAATTSVELLSLVLTVFLVRAMKENPSLYISRPDRLEALGRVDCMILPTRAAWGELTHRANALLLPGQSGVYTETLSESLSEPAKRLFKNALLTVNACRERTALSPFFDKTVAEPIDALFAAYPFACTDTDETLAAYILEGRALCRVFRRGDDTVLSLVGDCRYLLSRSGFWYCGKKIAPLSESDGMRFQKAGAVGVAIGLLPKDCALCEASLVKSLFGKLVFEGAILTSYDREAFSAWLGAFRAQKISLTLLAADSAEYPFFKNLLSQGDIGLLYAPTDRTLVSYLEAKRAEGRTVLIDASLCNDETAAASDLRAYPTDPAKREAILPKDAPLLFKTGAKGLRADADLLYSGQALSLVELKRSLSAAYRGVTKATAYLFSTLALKLLPTLFAIFLGKDLVSALFFVLMGLVFDTLAVFSILYRPRSEGAAAFSEKRLTSDVIKLSVAGFSAGIGALVFSLVVSAYFSLSAEVFSTVAILAVSLVSFWFCYFEKHTRIAPTLSLGTALTVAGVITLFVLLLARGSFGKFGLLFLVMTVALFPAAYFVTSLILKNFRENPSKKVKNRAKKCKKRLDKSKKV